MLEKIKKDFRLITFLLIPAGVIVNGAGGWVTAKLDIPLYFDSIGTIFVAVVSGPIAGAITGVITNVILGFVSESYAPYWPVPLLMGLVAGLCANAGFFRSWWKVMLAGIFIAMTAALTSSLVALKVFGEINLNPGYFLVNEPVDKIATALVVFAIVQILPKRFLALLPHPENVDGGEITK